MDTEMLQAVATAGGLVNAEELAEGLGCSEEEAQERLLALAESGHVAGPVVTRWVGEGQDWQVRGYGLLPAGRDVLDPQ